jgi:hypothetical protein
MNQLFIKSLDTLFSFQTRLLHLLMMLFFAASAQGQSYTLVEQSGIWVEQFAVADTTANRYTANNLLFAEGAQFTYRYYFQARGGKKYLQRVITSSRGDREKDWALVPLSERDSLTNDRVRLIVESDLQGIDSTIFGYNHTPIRWEYLAPAGKLYFLERHSLVENRANLWLHPPHARLFRILALNPYPFIKAPYTVGLQWRWQQQIPHHWGDARWREWTGTLTTTYQYTITGEEEISTPFGKLMSLVVEATGSSSLGTTFLKANFHAQYGFLRLYYTNIDGSELFLELIEKD